MTACRLMAIVCPEWSAFVVNGSIFPHAFLFPSGFSFSDVMGSSYNLQCTVLYCQWFCFCEKPTQDYSWPTGLHFNSLLHCTQGGYQWAWDSKLLVVALLHQHVLRYFINMAWLSEQFSCIILKFEAIEFGRFQSRGGDEGSFGIQWIVTIL